MGTREDNSTKLRAVATPPTLEAIVRSESAAVATPPCGDGRRNLVALSADGGGLPLHSGRSPLDEAVRQVDSWSRRVQPDWSGLLVVLGFAAGYHVEEIVRRCRPGGAVVVIDCNPGLFKAAMAEFPLPVGGSADVAVYYIVSDDPEVAASGFRDILRGRPRLEFAVFTHPQSARLAAAAFARLEAALAAQGRHEGADRVTIAKFNRQWLGNAIFNIPAAAAAPGVECLENLFGGASALVVGAGPSLDHSMPALAAAAGASLVIAAGTALKPLLESGVSPDFVVAVDGSPKTIAQFPEEVPDGVSLVATHIVPPEIIRRFRGRVAFFSTNAVTGFNRFLAEVSPPLPRQLAVGGTVLVSAIEAARLVGCRRIFLAGADLAFREDGTTHASGSMYDRRRESRDLVEVPGNYGRVVSTSGQFALYIDIVSKYLRELSESGAELVNVTVGGADLGVLAAPPEDLPRLVAGSSLPPGRGYWIGLPLGEGRLGLSGRLRAAAAEITKIAEIGSLAESSCLKMLNELDNAKARAKFTTVSSEFEAVLGGDDGVSSLLAEALRPVTDGILAAGAGEPDGDGHPCLEFYRGVADTAQWLAAVLAASGEMAATAD